MRFLLLGLGFVSTNLGIELSKRGHDVYVTYRRAEGVKSLLARDLRAHGVSLVHLPEASVDRLSDVLTKIRPDALVNCIGMLRGDRRALWSSHVDVVANICESVLRSSPEAHVIHISTAYVVGRPRNIVYEEEPHLDPNVIRPRTPYEVSKCEGERTFMSYVRRGLRGVILRPVVMYGPYCYHEELNVIVEHARRGILIRSSRRLSMLYVKNLANVVDAISRSFDKTVGGYFIVSEGSYSLEEIFTALIEAANPRRVIAIPSLLVDLMPLALMKMLVPSAIRPYLKYLDVEFASRKLSSYVTLDRALRKGLKEHYEWYSELGRRSYSYLSA